MPICYRSRPAAFTLIELLVVVSIIVLLLSLLAPAMDKAIYQAELAICGANQRTIATSATSYAFDNNRTFPTRPPGYAWDSLIVAYHVPTGPSYPTTDGQAPSYDMRRMYDGYMSRDSFIDPLAGDISLDDSDEIPADDPLRLTKYLSYSNYHVNSGWGPVGEGGVVYKKLKKIGDSFTCEEKLDLPPGTPPRLYKFPILVSDNDNTARGYGWGMAGHSYADGSSRFDRFQATKPPGANHYATISVYIGGSQSASSVKGDYNYAYTDGSVRRENAVQFDDDRMAKTIVTSWTEYAGGQRYWQLPRN